MNCAWKGVGSLLYLENLSCSKCSVELQAPIHSTCQTTGQASEQVWQMNRPDSRYVSTARNSCARAGFLNICLRQVVHVWPQLIHTTL